MGEKLVFKKILEGMFVFEHCGKIFACPPKVFEIGYPVRCGECGHDFKHDEMIQAVNEAVSDCQR